MICVPLREFQKKKSCWLCLVTSLPEEANLWHSGGLWQPFEKHCCDSTASPATFPMSDASPLSPTASPVAFPMPDAAPFSPVDPQTYRHGEKPCSPSGQVRRRRDMPNPVRSLRGPRSSGEGQGSAAASNRSLLGTLTHSAIGPIDPSCDAYTTLFKGAVLKAK